MLFLRVNAKIGIFVLWDKFFVKKFSFIGIFGCNLWRNVLNSRCDIEEY